MRKLFFIVSIGLAVLVAGSKHRLLTPARLSSSHASASVIAGATVTNPSSNPVVISRNASARHVPATALGKQSKTTSESSDIPLEFEANRGQAPDQYGYVAHGPTYSLGLSAREIALSLHGPRAISSRSTGLPVLDRRATEKTSASQLYLRLLGASKTATAAGADPKPGISNYFIGNDPAKWITNVSHFGTVKIAAAYPAGWTLSSTVIRSSWSMTSRSRRARIRASFD